MNLNTGTLNYWLPVYDDIDCYEKWLRSTDSPYITYTVEEREKLIQGALKSNRERRAHTNNFVSVETQQDFFLKTLKENTDPWCFVITPDVRFTWNAFITRFNLSHAIVYESEPFTNMAHPDSTRKMSFLIFDPTLI